MEEEVTQNSDTKPEESGEIFTVYEIGYHLLPSVGEEGVTKEAGVIREGIQKRGGTVIAEEFPKLTTLTYVISKTKSGKKEKYGTSFFGWVKFELEAVHAKDLEAELKSNDNILRFLLIKTVKESTLAPKRSAPQLRVIDAPPKREEKPREVEKKEKPPMSEDELNKAVEELMVE